MGRALSARTRAPLPTATPERQAYIRSSSSEDLRVLESETGKA